MDFTLKNKKQRIIIYNIIIWITLFILASISFNPDLSFALFAPLIIPVYLHLFYLNRFFNRRRYFLYGLLTLITVIVFGILAETLSNNMGLESRIRYIDGPFNPFAEKYAISAFFINAGFNPALAIIISTVARYFRQKQSFLVQQLREQKTRAELDLLKNQVNPHFLFNTLNTLYSMATVNHDEETATGISQLAELMRYMLYDTRVDMIPLEKETQHIQNFIELQKLRFSDKENLDISYNITGEIIKHTIPPMLFLPFVENAFKHGYTVKGGTVIQIGLLIYNDSLTFKVFNTLNHAKKDTQDKHSGIGIDNVRKRLELIYNERFTLNIRHSKHHYEALLKLPLQ